MTVSTSKHSRYDIDQRLTVDTQTALHGPLQHVPNTPEGNDNESTALPISTQSFPSSSASQRSIFSSYWKRTPQPPSQPSSIAMPSPSPVADKQVGQGEHEFFQQRRRIRKHNTYSYVDLHDPYAYFGIEEEVRNTESTSDTDDSSTSSYENFLRKQEVSTMSRRHTYHGFSAVDLRSMGSLLASNKKSTQSDTILFAKTSSLRRSCLRKGRFSSCKNDIKGEDKVIASKATIPSTQSVSFKTAVQILWFEIPVEKWAPSGWSEWFTS
eukprot:CAMPEP_0172367744 /NCGR_PEP_ID=MMETSP1060-20121228/23363_1 /TAXON_ID=37318 /ORGANISM="Pseudo-nitzschia pungens, Strain cf. cingulata" /LENGTH=267 /DNA_ID=CAMNT_0013092095 /DNA_START=75 /DNA_END=881 /DNA_ORIENTATION=+